MSTKHVCSVILAAWIVVAAVPAGAEVVEEIVAWVNGDIITMTDLQNEERIMIAEAYRQFTGEELDKYVEGVRKGLLLTMIDNKILVHRARTLFDLDKMTVALYDNFKKQQGIEDDAEFERLLAKEGLTIPAMKQRLLEMYAPDEVLGFEVGGRIAVSDREVQEYYDGNPDQFTVPGQVELREIVVLAETDAARDERRQEARALRGQAATANDFEALAREKSEAGTASSGGVLGPLTRNDLSARLETVAFALPVGEVSELIETSYGFHILKVVSRTEDSLKPYDEVKEDLRRALAEQHYVEQRKNYMEKARNQAEWCVKSKYHDRLAVSSPECPSL